MFLQNQSIKSYVEIAFLQLAFQTIGWGLGSLVWNSLRPGVNDLDADIPLSITDGLVNEDFAFTNLSLAAGQVNNNFQLGKA